VIQLYAPISGMALWLAVLLINVFMGFVIIHSGRQTSSAANLKFSTELLGSFFSAPPESG
jgi:hypothetical protein